MSWTLLILLSPLVMLILVVGAAVVVALVQAREEDVPMVWDSCVRILGSLARRVPTSNGASPTLLPSPADPTVEGTGDPE